MRLGEGVGRDPRVRAMLEMKGEHRVRAPRGCGAQYRMERGEVARWQRKMRDSQGVECLRNEDFRARRGRRGLKRNGR